MVDASFPASAPTSSPAPPLYQQQQALVRPAGVPQEVPQARLLPVVDQHQDPKQVQQHALVVLLRHRLPVLQTFTSWAPVLRVSLAL